MIYCISDIHGEYDLFMAMLEKIHFSEQDTLYVIGDVLDRGPHPIKVLQEMMKHMNIVPIVGNHEVMGITCLRFLMKEITENNISEMDDIVVEELLNWQMNGSVSTIDELHKLSVDERREIMEYLMDFSVYEEVSVGDRDYILVHAGFANFSPERDLDDYGLDELVWERTDYDSKYYDDVFVISGHVITQNIKENPRPGYIYRKNNHIAIDCGACFGGRLAAICLDTDEEFYVECNN